ncbi:MAG: hypothetical protein R6U41_00870, partial [Desulfosalsimonas sp.]|uniref:hypothetical protein n=1 Tax=Desulfosalsimonas sp. TaxID=3073848 RepID=UPI003970814C
MTNKNAVIIAHGDLDGVASAGVLWHKIHEDYDRIETIWSQPYWLADSQHTGDLSMYDRIFIVDIALNN